MSGNKETVLAIDYGSSNSVAYLRKNGHFAIVNDDMNAGAVTFPSLVMYNGDRVFTCNLAKKKRVNERQGYFVSCVKRLIGLTYNEYLELPDRDIFGCPVVKGNDGYPRFIVSEGRKQKDCIEVASEIFKNIKSEAERMNDRRSIKNCYVTVPANYQETQRRAIMMAAEKAGMKVNSFFIEPTAAAMSWCHSHADKVEEGDIILVLDFGGGTLDLSLLRSQGDSRFKVIRTDGNPRLGGKDVDREVANVVCERLGRDFGSFPAREQRRLLEQCEEVKIALGTQKSADVSMEEVNPNYDNDITLEQKDLAKILDDLFIPRIDTCVDRILQDFDSKISFVLMVGGSSRLYSIDTHMRRLFPNALFPVLDPESSVAEGALVMACTDFKPTECLNFSYGLLTSTDEVVMMLSKGTELPCTSRSREFQRTDHTRYIISSVYQWNGSYREGTMCRKPVSECILVADYEFKDRLRMCGNATYHITFSAKEGGLLVVDCRDEKGKVLNQSNYSGLLQ